MLRYVSFGGCRLIDIKPFTFELNFRMAQKSIEHFYCGKEDTALSLSFNRWAGVGGAKMF